MPLTCFDRITSNDETCVRINCRPHVKCKYLVCITDNYTTNYFTFWHTGDDKIVYGTVLFDRGYAMELVPVLVSEINLEKHEVYIIYCPIVWNSYLK